MEKTISNNIELFSFEKASLSEKLVLNSLMKMTNGYMKITMPDERIVELGSQDTTEIKADIRILNKKFFKDIVLYGDIGFGESYVEGNWTTSSITDVVSWMILNIENNPSISGSNIKFSSISLLKLFNKLTHKLNKNSVSGSKKNISAHYDLSNEFYQLFLDNTMTYSSAIFESDDQSLEKAQLNKYKRLCENINLSANDHILEIGSGWGGFSIYAAENFGCKVTTVTISNEQYVLAKERIEKKKLTDKITILLKDYRNIKGQFDKVVSIEMIEAVGHEFLKEYFKKIDEILKPDGTLALQVISSHDSKYEELRKGTDWIQKHIFPGSLLPSISVINNTINNVSNLNLHDLKNFGYDYAKTLSAWKDNFNLKISDIKNIGFDDFFIRKWNYYFSYCEAAFKMRNINLFQMIYTRPNNRKI